VELKKYWIIGGVVLVALAAAWFGRPAYRHFREARSVVQAKAFLKANDYANASLSARQALVYNPNNSEACQVMAALAEMAGSPVVLEWRKRIADIEPTITNKLMLAATALRHQSPPYALTEQILQELAPAASNTVSFHLVSARMAFQLERLGDAERHFAAAAAMEPANAQHQLNLAVLRLQSTNEILAAESRAVLGRLQADTNLGPAALRSLVADDLRRGDLAAARTSSTKMLADPRATLEDHLQDLSLLKRDQSPDLAAALNALQRRWATNGLAIYGINGWMIGNGLVDDALAWLQGLPEVVRSRQPVPVAITDCYVAKEDWAALEIFLKNEKWDDLEFLRLAYRSRAAEKQNQSLAAAGHWRAAVSEAGRHFGSLAFLLQLAERWKRPEDKEDLLWRIAERFPAQYWTLNELDRLYTASGNTRGQNRVYTAWLVLAPNDVGLKNNVAATSLLLKADVSRACELAREVYEAGKTNAMFVSTYAFALHAQGKTDAGLKLMQTLPETELQQPSIATYYAILLAAAGERDKATPYFAAAEKGQLLPEERQLLAQAREQK